MSKILEIGYEGMYETNLCREEDKKMYLSQEGAYVEGMVTECQACGEETSNLEIAGVLARCKDCVDSYHKGMERANEYLYAPWNPYDNDYEEDTP